MLTSCSVCSHAIWCEVRSIGAFCFVVYFNDEQSSNTYMEPITTCPGCWRGACRLCRNRGGCETFPGGIGLSCVQPASRCAGCPSRHQSASDRRDLHDRLRIPQVAI